MCVCVCVCVCLCLCVVLVIEDTSGQVENGQVFEGTMQK